MVTLCHWESMSAPEPRWWATELQQSPNSEPAPPAAAPCRVTERAGPGESGEDQEQRLGQCPWTWSTRPACPGHKQRMRFLSGGGRKGRARELQISDRYGRHMSTCHDVNCDPILAYQQADTGLSASTEPGEGRNYQMRKAILVRSVYIIDSPPCGIYICQNLSLNPSTRMRVGGCCSYI